MLDQTITENPYSFSTPAGNGRLFVESTTLLTWLAEHLADPDGVILLYGPPRIGKSSLLLHLLDKPLQPSLLPLYVDLTTLNTDSSAVFLYDLVQTAVNQLQDYHIHLSPPDQDQFIADPFKAFDQAFIAPLQHSDLDKTPLLLCDNIDAILSAPNLPDSISSQLYHSLHKVRKGQIICTLSHSNVQPPLDALLQLGCNAHHFIPPLSYENASHLIRYPVSYTVVKDVVDYIYQITQGHPYDIQLLCHALYERYQLRNLGQVTVADVIQVKKGTLHNANFQAALPQLPAYSISPERSGQRTVRRAAKKSGTRARTAVFATAIFTTLCLLTLLISTLFIAEPSQLLAAVGLRTATPNPIASPIIITGTPLPTSTPPPTSTPLPTYTPQPTSIIIWTATPSATPTATATPHVIDNVLHREIDGMLMVKIAAATFLMGSPPGEFLTVPDELPQHEVALSSYFMDKYEISVSQYAAFLNAIGGYERACDGVDCASPRELAGESSYLVLQDFGDGTGQYTAVPGYANYPINHVSWYGARAYCQYVGGRLPTEAEWEYAARGDDGRIYPWGNFPPAPSLAVFQSENYDNLKPVDALPDGASPFGILGMAGSMWEWVNDWYGENYYQNSPRQNPQGPDEGLTRVVRGGAWPFNIGSDRLRTANRNAIEPTFRSSSVGFRCARDG